MKTTAAAETKDVTYEVEYTDTFGGEANYCWVQRHEIQGTSERPMALVRRAKAVLGLSGVRCRRSDYGDTIELRPVGSATVVFISWKDA